MPNPRTVRRTRELRVRVHRRGDAAFDPQHAGLDHHRARRCRRRSGSLFATLADKLRRGEAFAKSLIFLPMAVSFVGASIVWRFIYSFRPEGFGTQIGLLNGIRWRWARRRSRGSHPEPWNNLLLMVIMVWLQTGFAMVILSAAIKAVPDDILEAARIDGATELQVFWRVVIPSIMSSLVVVTTTMVITRLEGVRHRLGDDQRRDRHGGGRRANDPLVLPKRSLRERRSHRCGPLRSDHPDHAAQCEAVPG